MTRAGSGFTTLITDCDGVLIDSEVVAHVVLVRETQVVFPEVDVDAFLVNSFGRKTEDLVNQVANAAGREIPKGFLRHLRVQTDANIEQYALPVEGVATLVYHPRLRAVVSNSGMARISSAVTKVGLSSRTDVVIYSADRVTHPKPAPDLYLLAASEMDVEPAQCLVIEDSPAGIKAALAAGMGVLGFVGGLHIPTHHASQLLAMGVLEVFEHMSDLPSVLKRLTDWE